MHLEAISVTTGYILILAVVTKCDWLNDVTDLRTLTSSEKGAVAFHLFDSLYAVKSSNDVLC